MWLCSGQGVGFRGEKQTKALPEHGYSLKITQTSPESKEEEFRAVSELGKRGAQRP